MPARDTPKKWTKVFDGLSPEETLSVRSRSSTFICFIDLTLRRNEGIRFGRASLRQLLVLCSGRIPTYLVVGVLVVCMEH